ncbi:hypothetical protein FOCC_FOCC008855, partial [Frankliniella occidentalis]
MTMSYPWSYTQPVEQYGGCSYNNNSNNNCPGYDRYNRWSCDHSGFDQGNGGWEVVEEEASYYPQEQRPRPARPRQPQRNAGQPSLPRRQHRECLEHLDHPAGPLQRLQHQESWHLQQPADGVPSCPRSNSSTPVMDENDDDDVVVLDADGMPCSDWPTVPPQDILELIPPPPPLRNLVPCSPQKPVVARPPPPARPRPRRPPVTVTSRTKRAAAAAFAARSAQRTSSARVCVSTPSRAQ